VLLKVTEIGCWFSEIMPIGISWPLDPTAKRLLAGRKKNVGLPGLGLYISAGIRIARVDWAYGSVG
jgi:hypothetical protein